MPYTFQIIINQNDDNHGDTQGHGREDKTSKQSLHGGVCKDVRGLPGYRYGHFGFSLKASFPPSIEFLKLILKGTKHLIS